MSLESGHLWGVPCSRACMCCEQTGLKQWMWGCLQVALGILVDLRPQHEGLRAADAMLEPCPVPPAARQCTVDAVEGIELGMGQLPESCLDALHLCFMPKHAEAFYM